MDTGSNIVMIYDSNVNPRNIISEYGIITVQDIKNNGMSYIGQHNRQAQKSIQMYHCISNFSTKASHLNIVVETPKKTVQVTPVGELMFKFLIQKLVAETKATASHLKRKYYQP